MLYQKLRIEALQRRMQAAGIDAALIGPSAGMEYLIGGRLPLTERLNLLIVPKTGQCQLILPKLQAPLAQALADNVGIAIWDEDVAPLDLVAQVVKDARKVGIDSHMWAVFLLGLQQRLRDVHFVDISPLLSAARICKDGEELAILEEAGRRFDAIWTQFFEMGRLSGRTENEIAASIKEMTLAHGFDAMLWCDVGSGPNGASPLHHGSNRCVERGDPVVIDFAATYKGYVMDTCRTPVAGEPHPDFLIIYNTVNAAYEAGLGAVGPGVPAEAVDHAARRVIEDAGFGPQFLHRLGHGLGIDAHEEPYIVKGNAYRLRPGMVFSNEPGIYVAGRWGVRIENIIVVTEEGGRSLNSVTRQLVVME